MTTRAAVVMFVAVLLVRGCDLTTALAAAALYPRSRDTPARPRRVELRITVRLDRNERNDRQL